MAEMTRISPLLQVSILAYVLFGTKLESVARSAEIEFSRDILPILSDNCLQCHGPDAKHRQADLRLDDEHSTKQRRDGGFVVSPGNSEQSLLIERITSRDSTLRMPPADTNRTLTADQINLLRRWIRQGAPWGKHWSFEELRPGATGVPTPSYQRDWGQRDWGQRDWGQRDWGQRDWGQRPIDLYIAAKLAEEGLVPSATAAPEKMLRRVSLDLTGLPPTLEQLDRFVASVEPDAYDREIDRLLASPRFGERMIWEWLEAARYADTNGYQGDPTRSMWYWRDWAISAFNQGLSYDQFTIEQLAGDLLPNPTREQLIATGFHRNHMINGEGGRIAEESRVEYVQDRVETTGTIWLGLTLTCARCHDHKYDPVSQREYYALAAYFNSIDETGANDAGGLANPLVNLASEQEQHHVELVRQEEQNARRDRDNAEKTAREQIPKWEKSIAQNGASAPDSQQVDSLPEAVQKVLAIPTDRRTESQRSVIADYFLGQDSEVVAARKRFDVAKKKREQADRSTPRTMVMRERAQPRETFVLSRGAYNKPLEKVQHGVLSCLPPLPPDSPPNRLSLARWIVAPNNPLMARVTVNRFWQILFGNGLVKTAEDFGLQGERPSHPELLDWLAVEFARPFDRPSATATSSNELGWDVKRILRQMVLSSTYRQRSHVTGQLVDRDPENRWYARGPRHRLPSWMIRDQALSIGGLLSQRIGGPPVKPYQPDGIWEEATFGKIAYVQDHGESLYRRSLYVFWRRIVGPTMFFDVSTRQTCQVKTARTNTPLHALVTLNDTTYVEAARAFAERIVAAGGITDRDRIAFAFRSSTARLPNETEIGVLLESLNKLRAHFRQDANAADKILRVGEFPSRSDLPALELAAFTGLANLILNLDETLSKE